MKRTLSTVLALILVGLLVSACGDVAPTATPVPSATPAPIAEATDTIAPEVPTPTEIPLAPADTVALPTVTRAPAPTDTSEPLATDTPAKPMYEELAQSTYVNVIKNTVVVGVFRYNGASPIAIPEIAITQTDANGKTLATQRAGTNPTLIKPGGLIPYKVSFDGEAVEGSKFTTVVQGGSTDSFMLKTFTDDFEVTQSELAGGSMYKKGKKIVGNLKNASDGMISYPLIIAALWDADGKLVDVANGTITLSTLAPGQEGSFEIDAANGGTATRYDIVASAAIKK